MDKMGKVFKNGPSKICGRQPLKILLGPFLNTLPKMYLSGLIQFAQTIGAHLFMGKW